jgi:hypothetical protein
MSGRGKLPGQPRLPFKWPKSKTMDRNKMLSQLKDIQAWATGLQNATTKLVRQMEKEEEPTGGKKGSKVNEAILNEIATRRKQRQLKRPK